MPETLGYRLRRRPPSSPSPCRVGRALLLATPLLIVVGCGSDDDAVETSDATSTVPDEAEDQSPTTTTVASTTTVPTSSTTTTTAAPAEPVISLTVEVAADDQPVRDGTLVCGDAVEGTGHLAEDEAARAACDLLDSDSARDRLVNRYERDPDMLCTMQYGGPDVAAVTGTVTGQPVETTFSREDGCAISDFDEFEPLIGAPSVGG